MTLTAIRQRLQAGTAAAEARTIATELLRFEVNDLEAHLTELLGMPLPDNRAAAVTKAQHALDTLRASLQVLAQ